MNVVRAENGKKKIGRAGPGAKCLYFVSGRIGLEPKFCFRFRAEQGPGQNFYVYFGPARAHLAGVTLYNGLSTSLLKV